jgi:hypothetical protein
MSVIECRISYASQSYTAEKYQESIPVEWLIRVDNKLDGPKTIIPQAQAFGAEPLPKQYDALNVGNDFDEYMKARRISMRRVPNTDDYWVATVEYDNTLDPTQSGDNPLDRAPIDDWSTEQFQRIAFEQIDGEYVQNSAGVALKIQIDDSRPILTYTRNEATFPTGLLTYQDCINSDTFLGFFPKYTAKINNISATKRWEGGVRFYEVQYVFHFRHDTWRLKELNEGNMFRPVAGYGAVQWPNGHIGLLDEDGTPLGTQGTPTFTTLKLYREVPFAPLNIYIY